MNKNDKINKGWFKKGQLKGIKRPPRSLEWSKKISESKKGKRASDETKRKMSIQRMGNIYRLGKKDSEETRLKKSLARQGKNNPNWKGGITPVGVKIRQSLEYKTWHNLVFERDDFTCRKCLERGGEINAHHILNFSDNEELRFDINNGITFCKECHREFHEIYGFMNNTREQIEEYLINE